MDRMDLLGETDAHGTLADVYIDLTFAFIVTDFDVRECNVVLR